MSTTSSTSDINNTYCSISFNKEQGQVSKKLCLTEKDFNNIKPDLPSKINNIKELESKYDNPYDLLKNVNNNTIVSSIKFQNLKPIAPIDSYSWLNNTQLDQIQEHFKRYFKGYQYSYIHMSDIIMFDNTNSKYVNTQILPVNQIDFPKAIKNNEFKYYGVIFNTDTSNRSGQHWFAIFMDFSTRGTVNEPYTIEYFNSAGTKILPNLNKFFTDLSIKIGMSLNKICSFIQVTNIQHQSSKTGNCGVYSLFYIYSRLNKVPYSDFNHKVFKIDDNIMTQIRELFFNDEKKYAN